MIICTLPLSPPLSQRGAEKRKTRFPGKIALRLKKAATKFLCMKTVSDKVVRHSLAYPCKNDWWIVRDPFYLKFWVKVTELERNRRFSIYFRSYRLSRTPSERSPINTNRKSTTRFPMNLRWTSYIVPKSPKGGSNAKCPKFEQ